MVVTATWGAVESGGQEGGRGLQAYLLQVSINQAELFRVCTLYALASVVRESTWANRRPLTVHMYMRHEWKVLVYTDDGQRYCY